MARSPQTSVRFDPKKMDLVKEKEGLDTPQKVIDFLLDQYWWKWRLNSTSENKEIKPENGEC